MKEKLLLILNAVKRVVFWAFRIVLKFVKVILEETVEVLQSIIVTLP